MIRSYKFLAVALISIISFTACEDKEKKEQAESERMEMEQMEAEREAEMRANEEKMEMESNSIAAKAMGTEQLSTLVSALQAAELAQMMKEEAGPFTVFAPTNDAFAKIDQATLENLLKPENKEQLQTVLKYHVVSGEVMASDLAQQISANNGTYSFSTVEGAELTATMQGDNIVIKDGNGQTANIVQADVDASNGVVHIIDAVVMKKS
ncbi:fasciclin domain-containing protein [Antarcticibacterium flavum]|uniref:Fasciclin domain-containing protein n=1 Tax=Antarcticibacterium flavum TaxID=2058175 RepID=A0A5B7X2E2_9FLAO|nr:MULTISPECIES: fasciclin domain-containing protein [Antarcticibacterium]MCM4160112.1 fasciclin [Antarcticibacterium sp. W02-3]QCY69666.1 fasciclin domain-containing protein [Antarcticibacterium flavum]